MRRAGAVLLFLSLVLLALPTMAGARTPGQWALVSPTSGESIATEAWLLRQADGSLLVTYTNQVPNSDSIFTSTISRAGDIGQGAHVVDGWASVSDPAVIHSGGGLQAFFGGIHTTDSADPNANLNYGTAPGPGGPWTVPPANVASPNNADDYAYGSTIAAAALPDGTPLQAWASTNGLFVHRGLDQSVPEQNFQGQLGACCAYDAQLTVDGSGAPAVAWYSNATGKHGVWYQGFDPGTTSPSGSPVNVPETSAGDQGLDLRGRIPLASCPGQPGAWIAAQVGYPSQSKVILWRTGASGATALSNGSDTVRNVGLACGPDGRLWVAWVRNNPLLLYVTRSNRARTRFGAQAVVKLPSDAVDVGRLSADAQTGILDLVATISSTSGNTLRAIQVLPALDIAVRSTFSVRRGGTVTIKAKVTDAGDPVRGVTLTLAGHKAKTKGNGVATVKLRHQRRTKKYKVTAKLRGYTTGTDKTKVKVKKR